MTISKAYSGSSFSGRMLATFLNYFIFFVFVLSLFISQSLTAQDASGYDEIPVFLEVPRLGGADITAVIRGEELYLPVTDLFDFLKIRNVPTRGLESISGFFINPDATYFISRTENVIKYNDKVFSLAPGDLIRTETNLYLKSLFFGKVFGLDCVFNFRSLSVTINSKLELPLIREMRQEEMRNNLTRLKGEVKADSTIGRTHPALRFGMADWSAISTEEINGKTDSRFNLTLGSMLAGGEATASLNYNSIDPFSEKQQYYLWRYVNNDFKPLRQVLAGKIATNAISTIYNSIIGVQLTNTPTTYRRSFGTYTLSDKTEPGWVVELYVNNVLVDYVKADASGFFTFEVPLVYGNSIVKLKFFGPWGEERIREQNINIPFNFLPEKTMEYIVSAGIVEDSLFSKFTKASINYGVTRKLTVGAGLEYLSSVRSGSSIPYVNASWSILNNLLLSGEYDYHVRAKGTLTFRLPSNLQIDLNYSIYDKGQTAINYNYLEERKVSLSIPVRIKNFLSYHRFSVYQIVLPVSKYTTGEWLFSGSLFGVSTNLTTYGLFIDNIKPNIYSNLSLAFRLPAEFVIMPQLQYGYSQKTLYSFKTTIEKHLMDHAYANLSFEQNFTNDLKMAELGFRYDFSFAQTGASIRQTNKNTALIQYARGSLIYDKKSKYLGADNRTNVGRGGIALIPYLDLNANGKRDKGEPKAFGLNLHVNGGRVVKSDRDTTVRILGLEPYTNCFVDLDPNSFDNVSWRLPVKTLSVAVDPDILKNIEIPVTVAGEASGSVTLDNNGEKSGLSRMIVSFFSSNLKLAGKTLTEDDGYFSYFGLAPGDYMVQIDTAQLNKLGMISDPESRKFNIRSSIDGDFVDGLDFKLILKQRDSLLRENQNVPSRQKVKKDTTYLVVHEVTQELVTITEDSYAIQLGAFRHRPNAEAMRRKLEATLGRKVDIIVEDDFYKVRISDIKTRKEVDDAIAVLQKNGVTELWVISLKAMHQQLVLTEKQDTVRKISETITENPVVAISHEMLIQLGAFRLESNALKLKDRVTSALDKNVVITQEGGYYKVRIKEIPLIDQTVLEEMKKLEPEIGKLGLKDMWSVPIKKQPEEGPPVVIREVPPKQVEWKNEIPALAKSDTIVPGIIEEKKVAPVIPPEPPYSLQVAVYHKQSEALRAQRKIKTKLNLPVETVKIYDYYHVIVTGFYTKEETYKYYPELAGLGFPGITLIENR